MPSASALPIAHQDLATAHCCWCYCCCHRCQLQLPAAALAGLQQPLRPHPVRQLLELLLPRHLQQ